VLGCTISHLKLSLEPLGKIPLVPSVEVLLAITPSVNVSKVKAFDTPVPLTPPPNVI
jgi:hypothetical protein